MSNSDQFNTMQNQQKVTTCCLVDIEDGTCTMYGTDVEPAQTVDKELAL